MKEQRIDVIFPSGRLAKRKGLSLRERSWMSSPCRSHESTTFQLFQLIFHKKLITFYLLDIIHPTLRDITLFNETLNKKDFHFEIRFGKPVYPYMLNPEPVIATRDLKRRVLNLNTQQF